MPFSSQIFFDKQSNADDIQEISADASSLWKSIDIAHIFLESWYLRKEGS